LIRRAQPADFLSVAALDRQAWSENREATFIPDGEHVWRLWTEHAILFVYEPDAEILGASLAFPTLSGIYCLHKIFVDRSCRGKGVGTKLMKETLVEIDRLGVSCFLTVDPGNKAAIRLYESYGFVDRDFIKGYYRAVEDRFVLTRPKQGQQGGQYGI
jgi:ribosomal protein S18 acetylase RimI-like enzyme